MASFTRRKEDSPWFKRLAINPFPSVAIFKRTQRIVNCASSQFIANKSRLLESGPMRYPLSPTLLNLTPITPEPPNRSLGVLDVHGRNETRALVSSKKVQSH